jgi:hypothetical protein
MFDALFSPDDVLEMRAHNEASLPHACVFSHEVRVAGVGGRETVTWPNVGAAISCRLSSGAPAQAEFSQADQLQTLGRWTLVLPADTVVEKDWHATVSGISEDGVAFAQTFNVIAVLGPKTYEIERKVVCADLTSSGR